MKRAARTWLVDCGPTTWRVGQSTHARACAAMSIAVSRGLEPEPILVRLLPRSIRLMKVRLMWSSCVLLRCGAAVAGASSLVTPSGTPLDMIGCGGEGGRGG